MSPKRRKGDPHHRAALVEKQYTMTITKSDADADESGVLRLRSQVLQIGVSILTGIENVICWPLWRVIKPKAALETEPGRRRLA